MRVRLLPRDPPRFYRPIQFTPVSDTELEALRGAPGFTSVEAVVDMTRHYHAHMFNQGYPGKTIALAEELRTRVEQLDLLVKTVAVLVREYFRYGGHNPHDEDGHLSFLMFMHTEAFYYFAHRVQDILEGGQRRTGGRRGRRPVPRTHQDKDLPHIEGFKRSRMITLIRNHLIEHPYGTYEDFGGSHGAVSSRDGPLILVRGEGPIPTKLRPKQDPGLFRNAQELTGLISPVLAKALCACGGLAPTFNAEQRAKRRGQAKA
jgi:hypothetical protein